MHEFAPRRFVLAVHSVQEVELQKVPSSWREVAAGSFEGSRKVGKRRPMPDMHGQPVPGLFQYTKIEEGCGASFVVENTTDTMAAIQFDASDCVGCNFTRGTSCAIIAVPPRS